jgi:hypothetical protein
MSDPVTSATQPASSGSPTDQAYAALFAQLVMQQANMAMMLLGHVAHPETGKVVKDVEAAKVFIDQLEMLEAKTKGNLTKEEEGLLKQSLMTLRLTFVDAVQSPATAPGAGSQPHIKPEPARPSESAQAPPPPAEEEHRTKFTKKY